MGICSAKPASEEEREMYAKRLKAFKEKFKRCSTKEVQLLSPESELKEEFIIHKNPILKRRSEIKANQGS